MIGVSMPKGKAKRQKRKWFAVGERPSITVVVPTAMPSPKAVPVYQRGWMLALALALVTAGIYSPVLHHSFVNFDDQAYIVENRHVTGGLTPATVRWALTAMEESNWHPLTWMSHALDCEFFGLNPAGHHAVNVVLHVANAILLFSLLLGATGARWRSLAVAALFALHPLNVESVAWAAERKNVLSMLFCLLALLAYRWYVRRPRFSRYLLVAFAFALGLAAKPMIVTLPFALLLLDYWPLRRAQSSSQPVDGRHIPQSSWWRLGLEKVPLLGLSAASSVVTLYAQRLSMPTSEALPFAQRVGNAISSYAQYLGKTFWPARLAVFYPHEGGHLSAATTGLCLLFLGAVTVWTWMLRSSRPYLLIGWLWFLGNLIPVIGLVQVGDQAMADRYVYLPLIGVSVMVVWGIASLAGYLPQSRGVAVLAAVAITVLVALSAVTVRQVATWDTSYDLWSHALEVTTDNYLAEDYIGSALLVRAYQTTGQRYSDEATAHFRNAVRINPHDAIGHLNLGADFHEHGRLSEAIAQYTETLEDTSDEHLRAKAYIALGAAYGTLHAFDKAERSYGMAAKLEPGNQGLFMRMAQLGVEERIEQLMEDVATHPSARSYLELGQLQQSLGRSDEARHSYEQALKEDPKFQEARQSLSSMLHSESNTP